jgi:hypothetical protein
MKAREKAGAVMQQSPTHFDSSSKLPAPPLAKKIQKKLNLLRRPRLNFQVTTSRHPQGDTP